MDLTERKLKILQAIIGDYVRTAEPVGSRTLSKKYDLGISPATIRNEMSDLEEMGYLTHPHTSAGRVPSDKAYRLYVNSLMDKKKLSAKEKQAIALQLNSNMDEFDKTIEHAAHVLSEITNLTSFAITPMQDEDTIQYVNLLPVDDRTVVIMIAAHSGKISNRLVSLETTYDKDKLEILAKNLTYNYKGKKLSEAHTQDIVEDVQSDIQAISGLEQNIMPSFMKTLEDMLNVNLYMDGLTNIFDIPEYNDLEKAKDFMELLNKKDDFAKKLINRDDGIMVTIGEENSDDVMRNCSLITATYHVNGQMIGKIGVIGPTRMEYGEITSIIEYLTDNLDNAFKLENKKGDDTDVQKQE